MHAEQGDGWQVMGEPLLVEQSGRETTKDLLQLCPHGAQREVAMLLSWMHCAGVVVALRQALARHPGFNRYMGCWLL